MAPKKDTTPSKKKDKYRIRNLRQYNQSLVNRGSITFWFDEDSIEKWYSVEPSDKPDRPDTYSDEAVRCGLLIKAVFRTTLRALLGFLLSIIKIQFRHKTVLGDRLSARREWTQATEVSIKLHALNRMTELGMPESYTAPTQKM